MNLVILTEEPSMGVVLDTLLPKFVVLPHTFQVVRHRGISDLRTSLPNKLKGWRTPDTKFLVLVDQDSADCRKRKAEFEHIWLKHKAPTDFSVRIVCQELEAWFLGDVEAVVNFGILGASRLRQYKNKEICLNPDSVTKPSARLTDIIGGYQKISGAKAISPHIVLQRNKSRSFAIFVQKVRDFCQS